MSPGADGYVLVDPGAWAAVVMTALALAVFVVCEWIDIVCSATTPDSQAHK